MNELTKYIRPQEIADALGWHLETVYVRLRKGDIPGIKIGKDWFIEPEAWEAYIAARRVKPDPEEAGGGLA